MTNNTDRIYYPDPRCEVCGHPVINRADHTPAAHARNLEPREQHTVTVTPATPGDLNIPFGDGDFTLACTCGERVTYRGRYFTTTEARRHQRWHRERGR